MDIYAAAERIPAIRQSTRKSLCERLLVARSFIDTNYARPLSIGQIARVAALSPTHFLRSFREAFGVTPHRYITERRLDHARHALVSSRETITSICTSVGFESVGSFSWLFKQHYGLSPAEYRKKNTGPAN